MKEVIFVVEEEPKGGYIARALGGSIFTEADTLSALQGQIQDAVCCHFEDGHDSRAIILHHQRNS